MCIPLFYLLMVRLLRGRNREMLGLPSVDGTSAKASKVAISNYGLIKRSPNSKGQVIDAREL